MTGNLKYREATIHDKYQFKTLGILSYGKYSSQLTEENWAMMSANIKRDATWDSILSSSKGFVCIDGNNIVGMAFLVPHGNPWFVFDSDWSYIRMVGVHPDYEGRGIAKTLTKQCIDYAISTNEKIIALHTSELMNAARHIYENLGFTVLKELEPRFGVKYWLYQLAL